MTKIKISILFVGIWSCLNAVGAINCDSQDVENKLSASSDCTDWKLNTMCTFFCVKGTTFTSGEFEIEIKCEDGLVIPEEEFCRCSVTSATNGLNAVNKCSIWRLETPCDFECATGTTFENGNILNTFTCSIGGLSNYLGEFCRCNIANASKMLNSTTECDSWGLQSSCLFECTDGTTFKNGESQQSLSCSPDVIESIVDEFCRCNIMEVSNTLNAESDCSVWGVGNVCEFKCVDTMAFANNKQSKNLTCLPTGDFENDFCRCNIANASKMLNATTECDSWGLQSSCLFECTDGTTFKNGESQQSLSCSPDVIESLSDEFCRCSVMETSKLLHATSNCVAWGLESNCTFECAEELTFITGEKIKNFTCSTTAGLNDDFCRCNINNVSRSLYAETKCTIWGFKSICEFECAENMSFVNGENRKNFTCLSIDSMDDDFCRCNIDEGAKMLSATTNCTVWKLESFCEFACPEHMIFENGDQRKNFSCLSPSSLNDDFCRCSIDEVSKLLVATNDCADWVLDSSCEFECPVGTTFKTGELKKSITCLKDGLDNIQEEFCRCDLVDAFELLNFTSTCNVWKLGSPCEFICADNMNFISGDQQKSFICLATPEFSDDFCRCNIMEAMKLLNATSSCTVWKLESVCEFECSQHMVFKNGNQRKDVTCLTTGSLDDDFCRCDANKFSSRLKAVSNCNVWALGSSCEFECAAGTTFKDSNLKKQVVCLEDVFDNHVDEFCRCNITSTAQNLKAISRCAFWKTDTHCNFSCDGRTTFENGEITKLYRCEAGAPIMEDFCRCNVSSTALGLLSTSSCASWKRDTICEFECVVGTTFRNDQIKNNFTCNDDFSLIYKDEFCRCSTTPALEQLGASSSCATWKLGDFCDFLCENGFSFKTGLNKTVLECSSTIYQNSQDDFCNCDLLYAKKVFNAQSSCVDWDFNQFCEFSCNDGRHFQDGSPAKQIKCTKTVFSNPDFCSSCLPVRIKNGKVMNGCKGNEDEVCYVQCNIGYKFKTNKHYESKITCTEGNWINVEMCELNKLTIILPIVFLILLVTGSFITYILCKHYKKKPSIDMEKETTIIL